METTLVFLYLMKGIYPEFTRRPKKETKKEQNKKFRNYFKPWWLSVKETVATKRKIREVKTLRILTKLKVHITENGISTKQIIKLSVRILHNINWMDF